jgi:hypothetical protein
MVVSICIVVFCVISILAGAYPYDGATCWLYTRIFLEEGCRSFLRTVVNYIHDIMVKKIKKN